MFISIVRRATCGALLCASLVAAAASGDREFDRVFATSTVLADALERFGGSGQGVADRGRAMLSEASKARSAGRIDEARRTAAGAYALLRDAVRRSAAERNSTGAQAPVASVAEGLPAAYLARRESALEMRKSVLRVASEKGREASAVAAFDIELASADRLAGAGQAEQAGAALSRAYGLIKRELVSLRDGDTLVRALSFESPEQEFHYELDRNDSFRMLTGLLAQRPAGDKQVAGFEAHAVSLRGRADEAGSRGQFAEAIRLLEASSREYLKVMRRAGLMIPG